MQFKQKRFRKVPNFLMHLGKDFLIGIQLSRIEQTRLKMISDKIDWLHGESFLPNKIGRFSTLNAEGKEIIRKDLPKEEVTRTFWTSRSQFDGRDSRITVTDFVSRTYKRYPRERLAAPHVPVVCVKNNTDLFFLIEIKPSDCDELYLHKLNLCLELFGSELEIQIPANDGFVSLPAKISFVNWVILPKGSKLEIEEAIKKSLSPKLKASERPVIEKRMLEINKYDPIEIVTGFGGYKGYVIYHFPTKDISVLESDNQNNATYVFDYQRWKELSKLSKTEIISNSLQKKRIIHDDKWKESIKRLLA
ncbi:hypothetical protein SKM54_11930 [Acinetobacter faecalis]|uniref:hypothetical protein n=1 Tax=Acinetobacter faecalis TaxID=2665161 RepID=UPI002A90DD26|nr:hypothetical protein [Acinetobacter faecalis]MDY6483146.1 hypothetical protein [Acinetobacter faecalis]